MTPTQLQERNRRWQLVLGADDDGGLSDTDRRLDRALAQLYDTGNGGPGQGSGPARKTRRPRRLAAPIARWLGDIREFFPATVVQVMQRDAFDRLGLKQMLLEPEFLAAMEADVHLVADLISLRGVMPEKTKDTARAVVRKVVDELLRQLEAKTPPRSAARWTNAAASRRPRRDIDWPRTIGKNLRHWQPEHRTIVPETLVGHGRRPARQPGGCHPLR